MGWSAWRHSIVLGAAGMLAVLATVGFAMLRPPMLSSRVPVVVQAHKQIETQALIAGSIPVLTAASRSDPVLSLDQLRRQVNVAVVSPILLAITVSAKTAADAQNAASAVARSYVAFVNVNAPSHPGGRAMVLDPVTPATRTSVSAWVAEATGFGTLVGLLLGVIAELALIWAPRRQRSGL